MLEVIMTRTKVARAVSVAMLAAVTALAFGSVAWAHDDYYYREQVRDRGYQVGYEDGLRYGRHDRGAGLRFNYKSHLWDEGDSGFQSWMGSHDHYKQSYRSGYENGYREAYGAYGSRRDGDDYRRRYDRDGWR
jgi:hypothetical protein